MSQSHDDIREREHSKFVESPSRPGESAVEVVGNFTADLGDVTVTPGGIGTSGLTTIVTINDSSWTALPASPLANRNGLSIQNQTNFEMKVNFGTPGTYVGVKMPANYERTYDIKQTISIYGRLAPGSGSADVVVEEIA